MGGKKKKWEESVETERAPTFSKTKKNGESQIEKRAQNRGIKKPAHFLKIGTLNVKRMGECLVGAKKYRFLLKKKDGEKMGAR